MRRRAAVAALRCLAALCGCGCGEPTRAAVATAASQRSAHARHAHRHPARLRDACDRSADGGSAGQSRRRWRPAASTPGSSSCSSAKRRAPTKATREREADALTKFAAIHRMAEQLYPERIEIAYTRGRRRAHRRGRQARRRDRHRERLLARPRPRDARPLLRARRALRRPRPRRRQRPRALGAARTPSSAIRARTIDGRASAALGAEAIARLNRLGIMVDVSHGSKQTALDAMRLSAAPVIASHSGIASVNAHPRNMDDETLLALKADGGVVQVVAFDAYLKQQPEEKTAALRALRQSVGLHGRRRARARCRRSSARLTTHGLREIEARWPRGDRRGSRRSHRLRRQADRHRPRRHRAPTSTAAAASRAGRMRRRRPTSRPSSQRAATATTTSRKIWSGNLLRVWREAERTAAELAAAR